MHSMFQMFLLGTLVPFLAFALEAYPRVLNRKFGVDIWTHLLYLKEYHKQKGIPKLIDKGFIIKGVYDYPPLFILILGRLPFKLVEKYEFLFSPFFDFVHLLLIFAISYQLTGNLTIAILTQVLYALTPIIILENSSATPRSLGYLLFTILMMSGFFFLQSQNSIFFVSALITGTLIFLTHRFTTQGFLFFAIFFSLINQNIFFVLLFIFCFGAALIVSKGFYVKVLIGHLGNLKFWRDNIEYRFAHQVQGNLSPKNTLDFVFKVYNQFLKFPPFVLSITNPWVMPIMYMFFYEFPANYIFGQMVWWVVISYLIAILTIWIIPLRFLGEGQRYLELSAFPTAFLSASLLVQASDTNLGSIAYVVYALFGLGAFVTIITIQRKAIIQEKLRTLTPELEEMFMHIKKMKTKPRLLCIPHQITTNTIYHTGASVFVNADYKNIKKISEVYPYIRKPLPFIMNKYSLDFILLNKKYSSLKSLRLNKYSIIKEVGDYALIKPQI